MPLELFNATHPSQYDRTVAINSYGGPLFVVNTDSQAENVDTPNDAGDPWAVMAEAAPNHANIRPFVIPSAGLYVDLFHIWRTNRIVTAPPRIQIFGLVPKEGLAVGNQNYRKYPYDDDPSFPNVDDWWSLLEDPDDPAIYLEFDDEPAERYGNGMWVAKKRRVYIAGTVQGVVLVTRGAEFDYAATSTSTSTSSSSSSGADQSYGLIAARIVG